MSRQVKVIRRVNLIVLVVICASVSIYRWVAFLFDLNLVSAGTISNVLAGTILNDQLSLDIKSPLFCSIGVVLLIDMCITSKVG